MRIIDVARKRRMSEVRPFYLASNRITIKLKNGYSEGVTGKADGDPSGKVYTAVDNTSFDALDPSTDDYTVICTTLVTDMKQAFQFATSFNQDIRHFDTSNVTNMEEMFSTAEAFNQPLNEWDVSNVTNMKDMFDSAISFNQPLNSWNVSNVNTMRAMFVGAEIFNQPLNEWDVSNVSDMGFMFNLAISFNQDLSSWCVEQIPSEPTDFDTGATAWTLPRPNWGVDCNIPPNNELLVYFGNSAIIPTNQTQIENLPNSLPVTSGVFELATGTTNKLFIFAIPKVIEDSSFVEVKDFTYNLILDYQKDSVINVTYLNGANVDYNIYVYEVDNPYPLQAIHKLLL